MEKQILRDFFQRMLPVYTPQAEKFLDKVDLARLSFRYIFSVEAMTKISYMIEDFARDNPGESELHVSFQLLSRVIPQQSRYEPLSETIKGLWLYGIPDIPLTKLDSLSRVLFIDTSDTLLTQYWFVIAYGPGIGMTLLAEEVSSPDDQDRYYEGFYTFEQDVAYEILSILYQLFPARLSIPTPPDQF